MNRRADPGELRLGAVIRDVQHRLDPQDEDCATCGGDGFVHECFDGCCRDAEIGCEQCTRRCGDCADREARLKREVRIAVLRRVDVDLAVAFARWAGTLPAGALSREFVLAQIHLARSGCEAFTAEQRADSACWLEGLL